MYQYAETFRAQLKSQDFVSVTCRGPWVAAHLVRTLVYKLGACQMLVVKESSEASFESRERPLLGH